MAVMYGVGLHLCGLSLIFLTLLGHHFFYSILSCEMEQAGALPLPSATRYVPASLVGGALNCGNLGLSTLQAACILRPQL